VDIEILNPLRLRTWCARIDLPEAAVAELEKTARSIQRSRTLSRIFAEFHEKTVIHGEWHRLWSPLPFDREVSTALGERVSLFYLLAYLSALPYAEREYVRRGIDLEIFRATMTDIRTWLVHRYDLDGRWSFDQFSWIWRHLSCELFRLGRLQFMLKPFDGGVTAFRSRRDGRIQLLADPNVSLRADGAALGAGRVTPRDPFYRGQAMSDDPGWQPSFEVSPAGWHGCPVSPAGWHGCSVSPYGSVQREAVFLPNSDWDLALQNGDTVLDLHIPRKDRFTLEDCRDSLRQAFAFFQQQYPERPFKACYCHTWFYSPQLQQILPPESNIVRFQREAYLYPFPGTAGFLWDYVFGEKVTSLSDAPRDTSLRRAVLDWLNAGGEIFDLAGVLFHGPEEWGSQPYMKG
jgi:hypothetical protein